MPAIAAAILLGWATVPVAPAAVPGNRLANPGAEQDRSPSGWEGDGFRVAGYGESAAVPDSTFAEREGYGTRLFVGFRSDGTLAQTLNLSDVATEIDGGRQELFFGGSFGGPAPSEDTARVTVQALDAARQPLAAPVAVGGPSGSDRERSAPLLRCLRVFKLPTGTRAVRVTLEAVGTDGAGMADALYATTNTVVHHPGAMVDPRTGCARPGSPRTFPADQDALDGASAPSLRELVALPRRSACRRRTLVFRIRARWLPQVERLSVSARSRTVAVVASSTSRAIRVRAPRRSLLVRLTVELTDGRRRSQAMRYHGCAHG